MSDPLLSPLNYPTCDEYNKKSNGDLLNQFYNCTNDVSIKKNPIWNNLTDEEKAGKGNEKCCNIIMQCQDPNAFFQKNKVTAHCQLEKIPDQPHFGDIQQTNAHCKKMSNSMMFGVY
jgi:hypothetical protein